MKPICRKCKQPLAKGLSGGYAALCECGALNTGFEQSESVAAYDPVSVDMSKLHPDDIEGIANTSNEFKLKKAGFTKLMDEVSQLKRQAKTEAEYNRYDKFLTNTAWKLYKKYNH